MDVAKLLEPHGGDAPSGENLEYDPVFVDMELAAQPGEERQEGDKIREAEDPDFGDVTVKAAAVLERSHDIRAAVFYAEAILYTKGLPGFAEATAFARGCLETHWATCHPELDEDDDDDPTMRINAVQGLNGADTVIRAMRRAPLTDSRMFGRMSLRMIEIAEGSSTAPAGMTDVPDSAAIGAAFQDTESEALSEMLTAALSAQADIKAIDAVFVANTPGQGPVLEDVQKTIGQIVRRLSDVVGDDIEISQEGSEGASGEAAVGSSALAGAMVGGAINSPSDVSNALDRMIGYYHRNEPSSPMPILLERAKKLVGADFLTIMKEIAPQGLDQAKMVGGIRD